MREEREDVEGVGLRSTRSLLGLDPATPQLPSPEREASHMR